MLNLSRKLDERIIIADGAITITVTRIRPDQVEFGIEAPDDISIDREEIYKRKQAEKEEGYKWITLGGNPQKAPVTRVANGSYKVRFGSTDYYFMACDVYDTLIQLERGKK